MHGWSDGPGEWHLGESRLLILICVCPCEMRYNHGSHERDSSFNESRYNGLLLVKRYVAKFETSISVYSRLVRINNKFTDWPVTAAITDQSDWPVTVSITNRSDWPVTAAITDRSDWPVTAAITDQFDWSVTAAITDQSNDIHKSKHTNPMLSLIVRKKKKQFNVWALDKNNLTIF